MRKEDKRIMKDIIQHKELEKNLPTYAGAYLNATYEYNLIHLVLNYYTMKEVEADTGGVSTDDSLSKVMERIHTLLNTTILAEDFRMNYEEAVTTLHMLRQELTDKMTVLTAYTDALQIYEYVLNRLEYGITGESFEVEENTLAANVFRFLFQDNDKMVINSKIQMVTGQLPVRMTKNRFFDYLNDTLQIYKGSDKSSVDGFVGMLKSAALIDLPEGYGKDYPEVAHMIETLEQLDYKSLDLETYQAVMEQFSITTNHLTELVSNYLLATEIVNDLYAAVLALPYEQSEEMGTKACVSMLKGLHDAFITGGEIPDFVDEGFMQIEGVQENLGEDIMQFEGLLPDVLSEHKDLMESILCDKQFVALSMITKLSSNSLFIDLEDVNQNDEPADEAYIVAKRDEIVALLSDFFAKHPKEVNRAVMAALFSNMPVLFNSQQEVKDYIEYSLNHCSNSSELMACAKILQDMMEEE